MKKMFLTAIVLSLSVFIISLGTGCKKDSQQNSPQNSAPGIWTNAIPTTVKIDTSIKYICCDTAAGTTVSWNFGDGQSAITATATHAYTTAGTYTITLTVTNAYGSTSKTYTISATAPNGKVKMTVAVLNGGSPDTTVYTYDGQGRIATKTEGGNFSAYSFGAGSLVITMSNGTSSSAVLNSDGLMTSSSDGYTYTYDANGYQISANNPSGVSIANTITNGNLTQVVETVSGTSITETLTYLATPDYRDMGQAYMGKRSISLLHNASVPGKNEPYQYTFDGQGRVSTQITTFNNNVTTTSYTYY